MRRVTDVLLVLFIMCVLVIMGGMSFFNHNTVSINENRTLEERPLLFLDTGDSLMNQDYCTEFEAWLGDHIGFRDWIVGMNAVIQYYVFHNLESENYYLGSAGDLNYADEEMLRDYQHKNLYSEDELVRIANDYQYISDWLAEQGVQFYYAQCYDKHSIYPEQFMAGINQYGEYSKTDRVIETLRSQTDVNVISLKEALLREKQTNKVFSNWGDPTHWNQRGIYVGYREVLGAINAQNEGKYRELGKEDILIADGDCGITLNGVIHEADISETFSLANPNAAVQLTPPAFGTYAQDERHFLYTNKRAKNHVRILVIGDSYFPTVCAYLAETFYETGLIWADYTADMEAIVKQWKPDILIFECAERVDRSGAVHELATSLQSKQ